MTNVNKAIDKIYVMTLQDNIRRSLKHNKSKEQHMELAPIGYKSIRNENNKFAAFLANLTYFILKRSAKYPFNL